MIMIFMIKILKDLNQEIEEVRCDFNYHV